jgi:hypothetical protein
METVFSVASAPRIAGQLRIELRESLEMAVEDGCEEMARKELGFAKKTSYVL